MIRKAALIAALAVAGIPAGALAAKPVHPTHPATPPSTNASTSAQASTKAPTVLWVLHGKLGKFTAANGATNGAVQLAVSSATAATQQKAALKSQTLTFSVSSKTNIVLHNGKPVADGDRGIVKIRAPKNASAATLAATPAQQVIDQGPST